VLATIPEVGADDDFARVEPVTKAARVFD
jgi:hypothetical protein